MELPPANPSSWDLAVLEVLNQRDGTETAVRLAGGAALVVYDIAWGYDSLDTHSHVTTNISPGVEGATVDFFTTDEVLEVRDPESHALLLDKATFESR